MTQVSCVGVGELGLVCIGSSVKLGKFIWVNLVWSVELSELG